MKKAIFTIFLGLICLVATGQNLRFQPTYVIDLRFELDDEFNTVMGESALSQTDAVITIDADNDVIEVTSDKKNRYDNVGSFRIVGAKDPVQNEDGSIVLNFETVDKSGDSCELQLSIRGDGSFLLYIDATYRDTVYSDLKKSDLESIIEKIWDLDDIYGNILNLLR